MEAETLRALELNQELSRLKSATETQLTRLDETVGSTYAEQMKFAPVALPFSEMDLKVGGS